MSGQKELIFDGTENPTERPQISEKQRDKYSGKKKMHTDVAMTLSNKKRRLFYVSEYYDGKNTDFGIFKNEFEPGLEWFVNFKVIVDLGFVGIDKLYETGKLLLGHKKNRKSKNNPTPKPLTAEQKAWNRKISKERIYVEHAIGGMKRYRMLKNKSRGKCSKLKNCILGVCAGLWNYKLSFTKD